MTLYHYVVLMLALVGVLSGAGSLRPAQAPVAPARRAPPDTVRGLYVNRWAAISNRMWQLIDVAKTTEVNALVIDVKDDRGLMLYRSAVPLARRVGADTTQPMSARRMKAVLDTMRLYGIHSIARIVVAKDPLLANARPEWAIHRKDDSAKVWFDRTGSPWLDATQPGVWTYAADIAAEAVKLGFAEIQFDYVRFPDERSAIEDGLYAKLDGRVRAQVIRDELARVRGLTKPLGVPMTIDVFGLTATDSTDMGIGQRWEMFIDRADVVLPMTYPSHFAPGTYGLANPNAAPYETVDNTLKDILRRSRNIAGAARIVPWYQDFTLGSPRYTAEQVRLQILAGYANGITSWMLWNPGSRYSEAALQKDSVPQK
ncbi:MAG: putative glycoside hydrolase [Gemmatimonadota bacterium]